MRWPAPRLPIGWIALAAAYVAAGIAIVFTLLWFVVPIAARMQGRSSVEPPPENFAADR